MRRFRLSPLRKRVHRVGLWVQLHGLPMGMHPKSRRAIIIAGEEQPRLRELTRRIFGEDVPGQFCPLLRDASLLDRTRSRVALAIPPQQTLIVVTKTHQSFYAPLLAQEPSCGIVVQPYDRGTAVAILYALLRSLIAEPAASVAIFPSNHYVADDGAFMRHVDLAFDGVRARSDLLVLLGITPDAPEVGYSWIEMGERIAQYFQLFRVKRFWQSPSPEVTTRLWRSGCLWNSSVIVCRISTGLDLFMRALPELYGSFLPIKSEIGASSEAQAVERVYADIPSVNLSEELLARSPEQLTVLPVSGVRWSSLEEPERVIAVLRDAGLQPGRDHE
jgi:mannose-1-phosphate guanylyltransferase